MTTQDEAIERQKLIQKLEYENYQSQLKAALSKAKQENTAAMISIGAVLSAFFSGKK